jgi:class 3 adenylate cyclase/tetratricopeptide (TPR) repeat protein
MTLGDGAEVQRLLERTVEAVDRAAWDTAIRFADQILVLDPGNEYANAVLTLTSLRSGVKPDRASGTRRRVTVMFCDMVDSTAFASLLDPEETREVLRDFLRACSEVVEEFDGHIASLLGDGLLAYFGFPRAHEDDATRAILAGCKIVQRVQALPPVHLGNRTVQPAVRVGIHSGLAVVAEIGTADRTGTNDVVGETPNLAARILDVAAPNAVVISSETLDLVDNAFVTNPLPATTMKGIHRRVDLFSVVGQRILDSRFDATPGIRTHLVGRRTEQERIREAWAETQRSGCQTLAILGEPGIGKSRLLAYAKGEVEALGGWHRTLQCSPYHLSTPLHPIVAALQQEAGATSTEPGERTASLVEFAEWLGFVDPSNLFILAQLLRISLPPELPVAHLAPEELRARTMALVVTWLDRLADRSPLLLAVEDLHWVDPTTLELLTRIVSRTASTPILTILTSRDRASVSSVGKIPTLTLGALTWEDCAQIVEDVAGRDDLPAAVRRLIIERSDGVPLYAEELTRMLGREASEGQLAMNQIDVPPTLLDLLVARLDQYPTELKLAQVIATVGQPVGQALLSRLLSLTGDEVRRQLDVLVDARLLRAGGDEADRVYDFRHTLQRDAAYQLQLHTTRRLVHAAVAAALAEGDQVSAASPELLAHHYEQAEDFAAAARQWYRAGFQHSAAAAHAEAIQHYESALAALERAQPPALEQLELDVRSGLAGSLLASRGYTSPEVAAGYDRLRELSVAGGTRHQLPGLFGAWAYYHTRGENQVSSELAQHLLDVATGSGKSQHILAAKAVVGKQLLWGGHFQAAARMLEEARGWQPLDDESYPFPHHPGIGAGAHLAMALWILGLPRQARNALSEAVASADSLEASAAEFTRAYTHCYAASFCHVVKDMTGARHHANRAIAISAERGFATWLAVGKLHLAVVSALTQRPADHIPTIRAWLDAWRRAGAEAGRSHILLSLAEACVLAGEPLDALTVTDEALVHVVSTQEKFLESPLHRVRGEVLRVVEPHDPLHAVTELTIAAEVAKRQGARAFELAALTSLQHLRLEIGWANDPSEQLADLQASLVER